MPDPDPTDTGDPLPADVDAGHVDTATLTAALDHLRSAPADRGTVELIVRRPGIGEREILAHAELDPVLGLVGDNWAERGSRHTPDGSAHPLMQLNVTSARMSALLAADDDTRALAGDQFHVDLDLGVDSLPAGTRLAIGDAVIEVTERPHNGCAKYRARFGEDALRFVNSPLGKELRLRGLNARVLTGGTVRTGDAIVRL
jgi:hypothetical protein